MKQNLFFHDVYSEDAYFAVRVKKEIAHENSKFQEIRIMDTYELGKVLVLNDYIFQADEACELTEMVVHVPLNTNADIKNVLMVGCGDGFSLKQVVKYPFINSVEVIEIDEKVTKLAKKYFFPNDPMWGDPKVKFIFEEGLKYLEKTDKKYDLIISTGATMNAAPLFTDDFFKLASKKITENGILVSDGFTFNYLEPPDWDWLKFYKSMKKHFKITKPFWFTSKRMPGGAFMLLYGSNSVDPIANFKLKLTKDELLGLEYYNEETHKATFVLPQREKKRLLTS